MRRSAVFIGMLLLSFFAGSAVADGWVLREGRFPGKSMAIDLTPDQVARLDYIHKCHRDNRRTPYVFHLTTDQSRLLKKQTGVWAERFAIFDSTHGASGVDLSTNALVRFAARRAEIPNELVATDQVLRGYEVEIMGWEPNPIEHATASQVASGKCPEPAQA